jgi:hypothetical protein
MKMPAAMARRARTTDKPPNDMNADNPVRMSQIANKTKPIFLLNFIETSKCCVYKSDENLLLL